MPHPAHGQQVVIFQCHSQNLSYEYDLDIMASLIVSQTWHSGMAKSFVRVKGLMSGWLCRSCCYNTRLKQSCSCH